MRLSIESLSILPHQGNVIGKLNPVLVLTALRLVAHVLQRYRVLDLFLVVRCVLSVDSVVEDLLPIFVTHLLNDV